VFESGIELPTKQLILQASTADLDAKASALAKSLELFWIPYSQAIPHQTELVVWLANDGLGLKLVDGSLGKNCLPLYIDFCSAKLLRRVKMTGKSADLLIKAMGRVRKSEEVIDLTAGLGRDSFVIAATGCRVTLVERSRILVAMLSNAIQRAQQNLAVADIASSMSLIEDDASNLLAQISSGTRSKPAILYLDPMFPERGKSAAVKKDMVILQKLLGKAGGFQSLLQTALTCATRRIVIKRPRLAPESLSGVSCKTLVGKTSRFEIYEPV